MGEPGIPTDRRRQAAILKAREIIQSVRDDEAPPYARPLDGVKNTRIEQREISAELDELIYQLAATLDLVNTALQRACDIADEPNGVHVSMTPAERDRQVKALRTVGLAVKFCGHCDVRPAACIGQYEDETTPTPACDGCCAHGCEDGHCDPIEHPALVLED